MAAKGGRSNAIGAWAFLIGVILAVILGLFQANLGVVTWIPVVLVLIGLVVGLLNVGVTDTSAFLLASVSLVIVTFMGSAVLSVIPQVSAILSALLVLFVPAAVIVALRAVFVIARD
jgi:ATP synthase protein I